ncbi:MAG: helicase, partial [bacterium]|nr:helicase [bacterium]
ISRDIPRVLNAIKCGAELPGQKLPKGYNAAVMRVKRLFAEEVKHRQTQREHSLSLTQGQRYVLRELRLLFESVKDEEMKAQINIIEKAFRGTVTTAINRELNLLRRNGVTGEHLLRSLTSIYHQHNMRYWIDRQLSFFQEYPIPKIVCSEALLK